MRRRTERGMVTVELAFASLVAMLLGVGVLLLVATSGGAATHLPERRSLQEPNRVDATHR